MKAYLEIEMPRCCNKCPMLVYEGHVLCICRALPAIEEGEILKPWKNRRKDCPLIPVLEHGRLIDADEFLKRAIGTKCFHGDYALMLEELVGESTTIIPAEPSEEQREYEFAVEAAQYCEMYEPTYDPETGAM